RCHQWRERDGGEAVEGIWRGRQQRAAVRKVEVVRVPRTLVQDDDRALHPPEVPDVLKAIHIVGEPVRAKVRDRRPGQDEKGGGVKERDAEEGGKGRTGGGGRTGGEGGQGGA